jgi:hypothetical protein
MQRLAKGIRLHMQQTAYALSWHHAQLPHRARQCRHRSHCGAVKPTESWQLLHYPPALLDFKKCSVLMRGALRVMKLRKLMPKFMIHHCSPTDQVLQCCVPYAARDLSHQAELSLKTRCTDRSQV